MTNGGECVIIIKTRLDVEGGSSALGYNLYQADTLCVFSATTTKCTEGIFIPQKEM